MKIAYLSLAHNQKTRKVVICLLLFLMVVGFILISSSYALFHKRIEGSNVTLKVGELEYKLECSQCTNNQIEISPNSSKKIDVQLTSMNPIDSKYELYYKVISPKNFENQVDGGYLKTSQYSAAGIIKANAIQNIQLIFNSIGVETVTIELGVVAGLPHNDIELNMDEITLREENFQKCYVYDYTGDYQTFTVPKNGTYKVELWGGGVGERWNVDIKGGYTSGEISLLEEQKLYVYVGQEAHDGCDPYTLCSGEAYNGGASGSFFPNSGWTGRAMGGSGATDVRTVSGQWFDSISLRSRIMVAGGSGISTSGNSSAGGLLGYTGSDYNNGGGGSQTAGGTSLRNPGGFGYGGAGANSSSTAAYNEAYGGGSGYYGGGGGTGGAPTSGVSHRGSGGGGSSFISGHPGCIAIQSEDNETPKVTAYSKIEDSYHWSGHIFLNTIMIDGLGYQWTTTIGSRIGMPTHDLISTMNGNAGNGFARITYLRD